MRSSIGFLMMGLVSIAAGCAAPTEENIDSASSALRDPPGSKLDLHQKPPPKLDPIEPWQPEKLVPGPITVVPDPPVGDFKSISGYAGFPLQQGYTDGSVVTRFTRPTHLASNGQGTTWVVDEDPSSSGLGYLRVVFDTRGTSSPHVQTIATLHEIGLGPWSLGGIALDANGVDLFVSNWGGNVISKFSLSTYVAGNQLPVVAGSSGFQSAGFVDGHGGSARFNGPSGIVRDASGNLFVADTGNHAIRKISPAGDVTTVASGGGIVPPFEPKAIAVAKDGTVYVTSRHAVYRVTTGSITLFAGSPDVAGFSDGAPMSSRLNDPKGIAVDRIGDVYVSDAGNHRIRKIFAATSTTTTIGALPSFDPWRGYSDGYGPDDTTIDQPWGLTFWGDRLVFGDVGRFTVRTMNPGAPNPFQWP